MTVYATSVCVSTFFIFGTRVRGAAGKSEFIELSMIGVVSIPAVEFDFESAAFDDE